MSGDATSVGAQKKNKKKKMLKWEFLAELKLKIEVHT